MLLKRKSCSSKSPLLVDTLIANEQQIFLSWRPANLTNTLIKTVKRKTWVGQILLEKTFTEQRVAKLFL